MLFKVSPLNDYVFDKFPKTTKETFPENLQAIRKAMYEDRETEGRAFQESLLSTVSII